MNLDNSNIYKNIKYRFLEKSDINIYENFIKNFDYIFKIKNTQELTKKMLNSFSLDIVKTVGVFDSSNNLILVVSGYFSQNTPYWYGFNHISNVKTLLEFVKISHEADNLLCDYAEQIGYFSHYGRRTAGHHKAFFRLLDNVKNKRYTIYTEKIYKKGEECKFLNHKFYFHLQKSYNFETVITFHLLNQEYRNKILFKNK